MHLSRLVPALLLLSVTACGHGDDVRHEPAHATSVPARATTHVPPATIPPPVGTPPPPLGERLALTDAEWRQRLTPKQYDILRDEGTEAAFSGAYWDNHDRGTYFCAACGAPLFSSRAKFDSGTGWPSFSEPIETGRVESRQDDTLGMVRTEVHCARCGGHLGHVFDDGPAPTGLRYCIDSVSLAFRPD